MKTLALLLIIALSFTSSQIVDSYNVDLTETSVSGLSAGGFMAVQFHVAFSDHMKGAGIVAGGPYICAQGELGTAVGACMTYPGGINVQNLNNKMLELSKDREIDDLENLRNQNVYLYSGTKDTVVFPGVMDKLWTQYENWGSNIKTEFDIPSQHAWITKNYGNECDYKGSPYISNCNYNQAWEIMDHIFEGELKKGTTMKMKNIIEFDQSHYTQNGDSLGTEGYIYVPDACQKGKKCKIHISFHGCLQTVEDVYDEYVIHTGLNEIAEANNIIVLYPQTKKSSLNPVNPKGCFDWWGYTDSNLYGKGYTYATKSGSQMVSIWNMINDLAGTDLHLEHQHSIIE